MKREIATGILVAAFMTLLSAPPGSCAAPSPSAAGADAPDCAACHSKQVKSMSDPGMHASAHAKKGIGKCADCHDAGSIKATHANVKPGESRFVKARRYPKDFCLGCHGSSMDLAKRTAGSKFLTDTRGKVVNPHDIPKNPKHLKMDECSTCHKEHKANPDVKTFCMGCHHTGEFISCTKCHS